MSDSDIKSLQSVLAQKFGDNVIVESYIVNNFLLAGENYGSKIVSVDVKMRENENEIVKDVHMIAKLPPTLQIQREMFDSPFTFKKEIFMYNDIIPGYKKLEIENGVNENEAFNATAKFYGARLSLNLDDEEDFFENAVILLENLKFKDYYMVDRRLGCDLAHAKVAIRALARFHSLGIATKHKNPEFFEVLKIRSKCLEFKKADEWIEMVKNISTDILLDKIIDKYYDKCLKLVALGDTKSWTSTPEEPWSTIIHADFWPNNMLFHKSINGELDDVKFVDFQNYLFLSPVRELTFFIGCGVTSKVMINHHKLLENLYYDTLIERLKILNCDIKSYSRETFNKRLRGEARTEFTHCMCMLKIITMDVDANNPDAQNVLNLFESGKPSEIYYNRLRHLILYYNERGWLDD